MILELPPNIEQVIIVNAKQQGISPEQYITSLLPKESIERPESFYKAQGMFKGRLEEMLAFQQELRDSWD